MLAFLSLLSQGALAQFPNPPPIAQPFPPIAPDGTICPVASGIASRIVTCVHDTVLWAVLCFLLPFSNAVADGIRAACTIAVTLFGIGIATGRNAQRLTADGIIFAVKLCLVIGFTWNFAGFFPMIIQIMDWLVTTASSYVIYSQALSCPAALDAWQRVDCALDRLIGGVLPGSTIASGVLGFLFGCIFSGPAGFSLFMMGLSFIITILRALFKAMYIYLGAFVAISLLTCLSPLIIPTVLFSVTKQYFERWLRLYIALILQPVFLFVYLSMLLAALDIVIFSGPLSLYAQIAGGWAFQPNFRVGAYVNAAGAYVRRDKLPISFNLNPRELAAGLGMNQPDDTGVFGVMLQTQQGQVGEWQAMIDKNIGGKLNLMAVDLQQLASIYFFNTPGMIDCANNINCNLLAQYIIQVMLSLITVGVLSYIFYVMLDHIPYLSDALTGQVAHPGALGMGGSLERGAKSLAGKLSGAKKGLKPNESAGQWWTG